MILIQDLRGLGFLLESLLQTVGAEVEYRRAIELNPNYASAHQWFSQLLRFQGRSGEAKSQMTEAAKLDPLSLIINVNLGDDLYYAGDFDGAIAQFKKVIEMNPDFAVTYPSLLQAYLRKKEYDDAMSQVDTYFMLTNSSTEEKLLRAYVSAHLGKVEQARRLLEEVESAYPEANIGLAYFAMGDRDKGFDWLERAFQSFDGRTYQLGIDFELVPFRTDARYLQLVQELGLASPD